MQKRGRPCRQPQGQGSKSFPTLALPRSGSTVGGRSSHPLSLVPPSSRIDGFDFGSTLTPVAIHYNCIISS
jgi:hypothetical protein